MVRTKSATLSLRIEPAIKAAAEKAAAAERRSLTSLIELLLERYLREQGHLPAEPEAPKTKRGSK